MYGKQARAASSVISDAQRRVDDAGPPRARFSRGARRGLRRTGRRGQEERIRRRTKERTRAVRSSCTRVATLQ